MIKKLLFCIFGLTTCISADSSYWDSQLVRSYVHYSDLQRRWAWSFLSPYLKLTNGDEQVLDIGCGDGKITADMARFIPKGSIIGIDPSLAMLTWARKQYHPLEYPNLKFQEGGFLQPHVLGLFDIVVSFCALQHCPNQQLALQMASSVLKPGGKLLILVPAMHNTAWNQARATIQARPEWAKYWKGVVPRKFLSLEHYKELLEAADLQVIKVEEVKTIDPFTDQEEILDWLVGTFTPMVPSSESRRFYQDWIKEYLHLDPDAISSDGVIYAKLGYMGMEAVKQIP